MISLVDAGPGTGKTTTLKNGYLSLVGSLPEWEPVSDEQEEIHQYIREEFPQRASVCFFAYHNTAKDNLASRLSKYPVKVFTFHGAGMSNIIKRYGYQKLVSNRTEKHIETITGQPLRTLPWEEKRRWYAIKRLLHYFKIEALPPSQENLDYLLLKYADLASYQIPQDALPYCADLLETSLIPDGEIEYADMVSLGKRAITKPRFTLGLVDESQDISRSTYQLVTRMCEHVLFVGDKNQAIGAYAGASEEMYDSIASKCDAIFPLKVTQRCPPLICDQANTLRPGGVLPGPNTSESLHLTISRSDLPSLLKDLPPRLPEDPRRFNCLFICRTNAGIISLALFLRSKSVPFYIIDKDLADELKRYIKVQLKATTVATLNAGLARDEARAMRSRSPIWKQICMDKITAIRSIVKSVTCTSINPVLDLIEDTFSPPENPEEAYTGTTIHKAKGMEAPNIFVVNPPIELPCCMTHPIQSEQETNLHFVAVTRSSRNLYWVKG